MSMRISDFVSGVAFLGLTLLFWWQTIGHAFDGLEASQNPIWYPRVLLVLSGSVSIILILRSFIGKDTEVPSPDIRRMGFVYVLLAAFFFMFVKVGFLPASVAFFPLLCWILGYRRVGVSSLVSVIFAIAIWYLFAKVFIVRPPGPGLDTIFSAIGGS